MGEADRTGRERTAALATLLQEFGIKLPKVSGLDSREAEPPDAGDDPGTQDVGVVLDGGVLAGDGEALDPLLEVIGQPPPAGLRVVPAWTRVMTSAMAAAASLLVAKPRRRFWRRWPCGPGARSTTKYQVPRASSCFTVPPMENHGTDFS